MYLGKLVELAPADDIFERPRHPYTQALLSAMPSITDERRERIILSGDIPSPIDPPPQCRFASRCFRQVEACWTTVPPLERLEPRATTSPASTRCPRRTRRADRPSQEVPMDEP